MPIRVVALEPTTVLRLDYEEAIELTFARPRPAPSVVKELRRKPEEAVPRCRPQAVDHDAGADSRFTRNAPYG